MDNIKKAHLKRAKEIYEDPDKETPGEFEEYFANQYVEEYAKEEGDINGKVIKRYLKMLQMARGGEIQPTQGLLGKVESEEKGPYPANRQ